MNTVEVAVEFLRQISAALTKVCDEVKDLREWTSSPYYYLRKEISAVCGEISE